MTGVPQGLVLGPALFNTFVSDMDSETEHTLSKAADSTRLCAVIDTLEGREAEKGTDWKKNPSVSLNKDK